MHLNNFLDDKAPLIAECYFMEVKIMYLWKRLQVSRKEYTTLVFLKSRA